MTRNPPKIKFFLALMRKACWTLKLELMSSAKVCVHFNHERPITTFLNHTRKPKQQKVMQNHEKVSLMTQREQDYGDSPTEVRETDKYKEEYVGGFVDMWDDLIDWDARAESEGDFFIEKLRERGAKRILDVACGTGFHSVRLLEAGFEVVSADGSAQMLARAFENGRKRGHVLRTVQADWRWLNRDIHNKFDAVICLGNSFTHLFSERDRRKALAEFYACLRHDGALILDQRNYDGILDNGFSSKHAFYYCGDKVKAEPEFMDEGLARFRYQFPDDKVFHLNMFPLRRKYVDRLMTEVGFQSIETYADFQETHRQQDPDFFVHIAEKSYPSQLHETQDTKDLQEVK